VVIVLLWDRIEGGIGGERGRDELCQEMYQSEASSCTAV
jgi:hypothetical protein